MKFSSRQSKGPGQNPRSTLVRQSVRWNMTQMFCAFSWGVWLAVGSSVESGWTYAGCTPPPPGLIDWWSGEEGGYDLQGIHHGTVVNGVAFASGKVERAFRLDGVDDYVDLGAWSPGTTWSVEAWVNPSATPAGRRTILGGFNDCRDWGLTMQDGQFGLAIRPPGGCSQTLTNSASAAPGAWYHLVGTCDGTNALLYVNGELKASGAVDPNYVATAAGTRIGGEVCCAGDNFPGLVDEAAIYERALTEAQIRGLFAAGEAGKCKPAMTGPTEYVVWLGNGHWYRVEDVGPGGISWKDAQAAAASVGGYLATITSAEENAFAYTLARFVPEAWSNSGANGLGPWLGGFQPDGSVEPAGGWQWVSGETFSYANWAVGEPNNSGGENALQFMGSGLSMGPTWNDLSGNSPIRGYVVEFDSVPRPKIIGQGTVAAVAGKPFGYEIRALNRPSGFGATGLPAGLTVDANTGQISGKPAVPGTFPVTLLVTNSVGSSSAALQLVVYPQGYAAGGVLITNAVTLGAADLAFEWNHVTVSNCTLTLSGIHQFASLTVISNGIVTHPACSSSELASLWLLVGDRVVVDTSSRIDVSARGYLAGRTSGNSTHGAAGGRSGGSHGSLGQMDSVANLNWTYDDFRRPHEPGSGGGPDLGNGTGGGLLRLTADSVSLDGSILANGASGFDYYNRAAGGGGGIWLEVGTLTGAGWIAANGGDGSQGDGGSGGGGRVAVYYSSASGFALTNISARGGSGGRGPGGVGTVYLKQNGSEGVLRIDSQGAVTGMFTPLGARSESVIDLSRETLVIAGTNVVVKPEHQIPLQANNLTLSRGAVLTHQPTTREAEYSLLVRVAKVLSIDTSAKIDVSGLGYAAGVTLGNVNQGGTTFRAGGSYGGLGSPNGTPNAVYGDFRNPNELGSGGGTDLGNGNGGGLVRITAGSLVIDGLIAANGRDGFDYYNRAAGSGGGIRIDVTDLSGSGAIRADGGNGSQDGGSGGGGRVAIYYATTTGFSLDRVTAHGGNGGSGIGAVGSVYLKPVSGQAVLRLDNHGGTSGSWTPLGIATDGAFDIGPDKLVISGTNVVVKPEHQMPVAARDLVLQNQSTLTHLPTTGQQDYSLLVTLAGSLSVDASSRIDVSGLGYAAGITLGNVNQGGTTFRAGGSYGGLGSPNGTPNVVYGDFRNPNELGSGGGTDLGNGNGGGLVRITAAALILDGEIAANGKDGYDYYNRASGSGGGIRIDVDTLSGSGVIRANGGNGSQDGGSGGGGRVAVYYATTSGFNLEKVTAHGGNGGSGAGAVGSVYLKMKSGEGVLRFDNHGTASGSWIPIGIGASPFFDSGDDRVVISGEKMVAKPEHDMPLVIRNLTLEKGAILTHLPTTAQEQNALVLTVAGSLVIDATSRIDVSGLGYGAGTTIGNTKAGGATFRSGGSYGGLGGPNGVPNSVYGDYRDPNEVGSGGGADLGNGNGGGLVRITASSLVLDGAIMANGRDGFDYYNRGAGSGGGVSIHVDRLSGTGVIHADGGNGSQDGGGGGGGRVAVYFAANSTFDVDRISAHGGSGGGGAGAVGTIYLKSQDDRGTLRLDSHGTLTGSWTPLGVGEDDIFDAGEERIVISGTNVVVKSTDRRAIKAYSFSLAQGAVLTHRPATATEAYLVDLRITDRLAIDAQSRIDVSGLGYLAGRTSRNSADNAASGRSGGSYGGVGGVGSSGQPNRTYGNPLNPDEPGAGGGTDLGNAVGGGLARITAGSILLDGGVLAHGGSAFDYYNRSGASGGGLLISAGSLQGQGTIAANGGGGWNDGASGGGGRIALYVWDTISVPRSNIVALGGQTGLNAGQTGTVSLATAPLFFWENPEARLAHGIWPLKWAGFGVNPTGVRVDVLAFRGGWTYPIVAGQSMEGALNWETSAVPDGEYELRAVFRNGSQQVIGEATRTVTVINQAQWHFGTIASSEDWSPSEIHIVEGNLKVDQQAVVTILAGTTIKFAPGARITVLQGGAVNAQGTAEFPITFTSLADDAAAGDTNLDGTKSRPQPGEWAGFSAEADGKLTYNQFVQFRYLRAEHKGTLAKSEIWLGTFLHQVTGDIVVPNGVTLTIEPGAVLKFDPGLGLTVGSGGQLMAQGTVAEPITFTSSRDDATGGDTNADGDKTQPGAGDWHWILLDSGKAEFDSCIFRYGGGPAEGGWGPSGGPGKATIKTQGNASLTFSNSVLEDSFFDGILSWGGPVKVVNSVFTGIDRAVTAHPGSVVDVVNCTLNDNRVGLLIHGGELRVTNSVVANSFTAGILHDYGADALTIRSSDLWNPKATDGNYSGTAEQTGMNGNLSVDPRFRDAARRNYRLDFLSPCVDAANGRAAPSTDLMGAPRYDDPRMGNTGTVAGNGAFADLGAYEFVETAESDLDLVVSWVRGPSQVRAGERVKVQWLVANLGKAQALGPWHDAITLVAESPQRGVTQIDVAEPLTSATLGPNETFVAEAEVEVPGGTEGVWHWQVTANARGEIFEGRNWSNNASPLSPGTELHVPELVMERAITHSFVQVSQPAWFKLQQPAGTEVLVTLDAAATSGRVRIYAGFDSMPTETSFDARNAEWNSVDVRLGIASAPSPRTVYLLLLPEALGGEVKSYTLRVAPSTFNLAGVGLAQGGNVGQVTVPLLGSGFADGLSAQLRSATGAARLDAVTIHRRDSANALATFNLAGAAPGLYHVVLTQQGLQAALNNGFTIVPGAGGRFTVTLSLPAQVRVGRPFQCVLEFGNAGDTDVPVPLIYVQNSGNHLVWFGSKDDETTQTVLQTLAIPETGAVSRILRPGEEHRLTFYSKLLSGGSVSYSANWIPGDSAAIMDWNSARNDLRPAGADTAWDGAWNRLVTESGTTVGDYISALVGAAEELSQAGRNVCAPGELLAYLVEKHLMDAPDASLRGTVFVGDAAHPLLEQTIALTSDSSPLQFVVQSGRDGSFAFRNVPAGIYTVTVAGYLPEPAAQVEVPRASPIHLTVKVGASITGRIVSAADDAPVQGAIVSALDSMQPRNFSASADADGRYLLSGLPVGTYEIQVLTDAFAPPPRQLITIVADETVPLSLSLLPGGSLAGTIRNSNGNVVTAALVQAFLVNGNPGGSALSDTQGRFLITGLAEGAYHVLASAATSGVAYVSNVPVPFAAGSLNLTLAAAASVSVTVKDARTGAVVPGAAVAIDSLTGEQVPSLTDATGRFALLNIPPGPQNLVVSADSYLTALKAVTLTAGNSTSVEVRLRPAGSISGRVFGAAGAPMGAIEVSLASPNGATATVATSAQGEFTFTNLPDGIYELAVASSAGMAVGRRTFTLNASANTFDSRIELDGVELRGRILRSDGTTAAGHSLVYLRRSDQTLASTVADTNGFYRFLVFGLTNVDLAAVGAEVGFLKQESVSLASGGTVTAANLVAGKSALHVTVRTQSAAAPVSNAWVTLRPVSAFPAGSFLFAFTDGSGSATFPSLTEQTYDVDVSAPGLAGQSTRVSLAGTSLTTSFSLSAGCVVQGLVTDDSGQPVTEALVSCVQPATGQTFSVLTGSDGRYALSTLPAGVFDFWIVHPRLTAVQMANVATVAGLPRNLRVVLSDPGSVVQGRVLSSTGQPLLGARVTILTETGLPLKATLTDPAGGYLLSALPAGLELTIQVSADGLADSTRTVTLPSAASLDFTMNAPQALALAPASAAGVAVSLAWATAIQKSAAESVQLQGIGDRISSWWNSTSDFWTSFPKPTRSSEDTPDWRTGFHNYPAVNPKCPSYGRYQQVLRDTEASLKQVERDFAAWVSAHEALKESNKGNLGLAAAQTTKLAAKLAAFAVTLEGAGAALGSYGVVAGEATIVEYAGSAIALLQNALVNTINALQEDNFDRTSAGVESMLDLASDLRDKVNGTPLWGPLWLVVSSIKDLAETWKDTRESLRDHYNLIDIYRSSRDAYFASLARHWAHLNTLQAVVSLPCPANKPPGPKPPIPGQPGGQGSTTGIGSYDPNDKLTVGYGSQGFVSSGAWLIYTIRFENKTNATAAAQLVTVTDALDPKLDWSTFELMSLGFNGVEVPVPAGLAHYATTTAVMSDPANDVDIQAGINPDTGVATWIIESIDPVTGAPPEDPLAGFLPPNDAQHRGEGYVSYRIRTRSTLATGAVITNRARIVFDVNPPIDTPTATNVIDTALPSSAVASLPSTSPSTFEVRWSGADAPGGSGLTGFDVYVSRDGGPYALWMIGTTNPSMTFAGEPNASYAFYSVAVDGVGNRELPPAQPDATTRTSAAVEEPRLAWTSLGNTIILSWPAEIVGYILESASDLDGAWTSVPNSVVIIANQNTVTYGITPQHRFFRLRLR